MRNRAGRLVSLGLAGILAAAPLEGAFSTENNKGREKVTDRQIVQANYSLLKEEIEGKRKDFARAYDCLDNKDKAKILKESGDYLTNTLVDRLFPQWFGTRWDYNGTSQNPGEGKIACGYFVTTLTRDVGFNIQRVGLAQDPSETMIVAMVNKKEILRFPNQIPENTIEAVKEKGKGLYVVGLDNHTGFMYNDGEVVSFIHSSYMGPVEVVCEEALKSKPFTSSKYVVVGKLFDDDLIVKWLKGERIE